MVCVERYLRILREYKVDICIDFYIDRLYENLNIYIRTQIIVIIIIYTMMIRMEVKSSCCSFINMSNRLKMINFWNALYTDKEKGSKWKVDMLSAL